MDVKVYEHGHDLIGLRMAEAASKPVKFLRNLSHTLLTVNGTPLKNVYKGLMKVALANGLMGLLGSFGVGLYLLNMNNMDIIICIAASFFAALVSILATLKAVKRFPSVKQPNARLVRAWCILVFFYFTILFALAPPLRNMQSFLYLIFPLILTNGFSILVFGPIQDYLVSAEQKKRR